MHNISLIIAIFEKLMRYGPEAVIEISAAFEKKENITAEDINNLKITKKPEEYFHEKHS